MRQLKMKPAVVETTALPPGFGKFGFDETLRIRPGAVSPRKPFFARTTASPSASLRPAFQSG